MLLDGARVLALLPKAEERAAAADAVVEGRFTLGLVPRLERSRLRKLFELVQVQKTCQFWLLTCWLSAFWLLTVPSPCI